MAHCGGGAGTSTFDALAALEAWVEHGVAPDSIPASRATGGRIDRTRPLCAYPLVARYKGAGSIDEAANFVCADAQSRSYLLGAPGVGKAVPTCVPLLCALLNGVVNVMPVPDTGLGVAINDRLRRAAAPR